MEKQIHKEWTEGELNNLPELYKTNSIRQIALLLNRTYDGVSAKINRLKLKKIRLSKPKPILKELLINQGKDWTIEDELILKQKYESKSNRELSEILKRDKGSLMKKANSMGLYKSNKKRSEVAKKWTQEEDNKLKEVYNLMTNANIAELFNASLTSVEHRAAKFGLRKTKEYISKVHTGVKRTTGRNLTFEFVKEIASKYKSKAEFQTKDCSAYNIALRRGWLDKICSHMLSLRYGSLPQLVLRDFIKQLFKLDNSGVLYSTRKVIKPLELDVWVPIYKLAFEYDGIHGTLAIPRRPGILHPAYFVFPHVAFVDQLPNLALAQIVEALVDGDFVDPGDQRAAEIEALDGQVDLRKYLLCNVFHVVALAHDTVDDREHLALVALHNLAKRRLIAGLRTLH